MFTILTVLAVIAGILLIIVILLQNAKGEGLASNFVAGNQTFGVRQTADMLEKVTWGLVSFILVVAVISSFTTKPANMANGLMTEQIEKAAATQQPSFPSAPVPQANPTTNNSQAKPATATPATKSTKK